MDKFIARQSSSQGDSIGVRDFLPHNKLILVSQIHLFYLISGYQKNVLSETPPSPNTGHAQTEASKSFTILEQHMKSWQAGTVEKESRGKRS